MNMKSIQVSGICGICTAGCGVHMTVQNDKITRLVPWKEHPRGVICPRGVKGPEIVYSKDRLMEPLKRVGKRGEGKFEVVTWDEAFQGIADGLQPRQDLTMTIRRDGGDTEEVELLCRIDTLDELDYYRHGGILHYVLRQLAAA